MATIVGGFVLFILIIILISPHLLEENERREKSQTYYETNYREFNKGIETINIKKAEKSLEALARGYEEVRDFTSGVSRDCYEEDILSLREHIQDLKREKWEDKAFKALDSFSEFYYLITEYDFKNVDKAYTSKNRCLKKWDLFWSLDESKTLGIDKKAFFKNYFGNDYDPCFDSRQALEERLKTCVDAMRPEYKRKLIIYDDLLKYIFENKRVLRCELLRKHFSAKGPKEVSICYDALLEKKKIRQVKEGNKYAVYLSEKENERWARKEKSSVDATANKSNKHFSNVQAFHENTADLSHYQSSDDFDVFSEAELAISYLELHQLEFVDKMPSGGGLYFFDEKASEELKARGVKVQYAANGSRSTGNRPAWYIKSAK
ncbi:MAG: hypothetical protein IJ466_07125 [Clostridia bacterium]|nr:hypothetical protein [Clostridia bacterium]